MNFTSKKQKQKQKRLINNSFYIHHDLDYPTSINKIDDCLSNRDQFTLHKHAFFCFVQSSFKSL